MARWDAEQATALSLGLDPDIVTPEWLHSQSSDLRARYARRRDLIANHQQAGRIPHYVEPAQFASWAQANAIGIDPALAESVQAHGGAIIDWRCEVERLRAALAGSQARVAAFEDAPTGSGKERRLVPKEEASLLKLVLGMAIDKYSFKPRMGNSRTPKLIADALAREGMAIDEDTVRKWLSKAAEEIDCGGDAM
jgi:hypothetical protein